MKKEFLPALILSILCAMLLSGIYPLLMLGIAKLAPNKGEGTTVQAKDKQYYSNIAQRFTDDKYFQPRPSAVDYNAAGSAGSNKGPTNPDYLATIQQRIDSFMAHNPTVKKQDIPADMVTASGSGLDPHISPNGAEVQIARIARARNISTDAVKQLVEKHIQKPLWGFLGPEKVNVLELNIELDNLK